MIGRCTEHSHSSVALITAGIGAADVATTLAWKEPGRPSTGRSSRAGQNQLAQLERARPGRPAQGPHVKDIRKKVDPRRPVRQRVHTGEAIGRIQIPDINLDVVAVQGTDTASLQKGPGHYPETPFPGQVGTSAFAGHRTTYLAPFRHLDQLKQGDEIKMEMPYANFAYRVQKTRIVDASDVNIIHKVPYQRLVLTACHPLYSAAQRIAAFAKLKVSFFAHRIASGAIPSAGPTGRQLARRARLIRRAELPKRFSSVVTVRAAAWS
jgi:sortase A